MFFPPSPTRLLAPATCALLLCLGFQAQASSAQPGRPGIAHASPKPPAPWTASSLENLARPDALIIIDHTHAPGAGDPPEFNLHACATQRNLDEVGREQAQALGNTWKNAGIFPTRIFTSAWCRCVDTALQLKMGPIAIMSELNAIGENAADRTRQNAALKDFIYRLDPRGGPYVMVTHSANIEALTGQSIGAGKGVVAQINRQGGMAFELLPEK